MQEAREFLKEEGLARAASSRAVDDVHRSGRGLRSLFDADASSPGPVSSADNYIYEDSYAPYPGSSTTPYDVGPVDAPSSGPTSFHYGDSPYGYTTYGGDSAYGDNADYYVTKSMVDYVDASSPGSTPPIPPDAPSNVILPRSPAAMPCSHSLPHGR